MGESIQSTLTFHVSDINRQETLDSCLMMYSQCSGSDWRYWRWRGVAATGEVRACYNLGGVYYSKARHLNRPQSADLSEYAGQFYCPMLFACYCLEIKISFDRMNLKLTQEMGDRVGEGRACGNIGLAYHLLGDFKTAVQFHNERLQIAKEFGDKRAMRRAYSNLGNASVFLGELEPAIQYYSNALAVARELKDIAAEGQAFYSLGNCFTLLRDYRQGMCVTFFIGFFMKYFSVEIVVFFSF
ncbi:tetratricopeptide repeat protein [Trichinella nativa]|uniref:Tetratricopeptide repeat protein n=1 Tax=Trichinella nativa TaxID=6335 RepID=A0A1Y3ED29_9BILA|nr:tetratricopeptide repeat protein [Trichinella nativa]